MSNDKVVFEIRPHNEGELEEDQSKWKDFLAIIKIKIVQSNLITTFTGLWLALHFTKQGFFSHLDVVIATLLGTAFIIAGACSLNNYIDRDIDYFMSRTKNRPTVTEIISPRQVLAIGLSFVSIGMLFLLYTTFTAVFIGLFGVFFHVVIYSLWAKRRVVANTVIGSFSAVSPLLGWAAIDSSLPYMSWLLLLILFVWQPPHFYALAMRRVEEYRKADIPMLPVVRGFARTKLSINLWVVALLPIPFFMGALGAVFVIVATALNIGWIVLGVSGYIMNNDLKWARYMFIYSINYVTVIFLAMIVATFL